MGRLQEHPRLAAGIAFGFLAGAVGYFSWIPDARVAVSVQRLCAAVALAHAITGAWAGRRLIQPGRTRRQAFATGALVSLAALVLFTPGFTVWVMAGNTAATSAAQFAASMAFVAVASVAAGWWAIILLCGALGAALHAASRAQSASPSSRRQ